MSILINRHTTVICQGMTGRQGTIHSLKAIKYGVKLLGGITPGKGGTTYLGIPVFNKVQEITNYINIDASVIYVPAIFAKNAIIEAIESGIKIIVCITEGIPILDMIQINNYISDKNIF